MTHRSRLKLGSIAFAVLWTAWMLWCLTPLRIEQAGLLLISGALAGLAWYWAYGQWYRWYFAGRLFPRRRTT